MLIQIGILLIIFIFIVYLSRQQIEGLTNQFEPISIRQSSPDYIYKKLTTPTDPLYNKKFTVMNEADIIKDMAYFNNASKILFTLNKYSTLELTTHSTSPSTISSTIASTTARTLSTSPATTATKASTTTNALTITKDSPVITSTKASTASSNKVNTTNLKKIFTRFNN